MERRINDGDWSSGEAALTTSATEDHVLSRVDGAEGQQETAGEDVVREIDPPIQEKDQIIKHLESEVEQQVKKSRSEARPIFF